MGLSVAPLTTLSKNGQVVIPDSIRKALHVLSGTKFAVFAGKDAIILKKVEVPSAEEAFSELHAWGTAHADALGLKETDFHQRVRARKRR